MNKVTPYQCLPAFLIHCGTQNTKNQHKIASFSTTQQFLQASCSGLDLKFRELRRNFVEQNLSFRMVPLLSVKRYMKRCWWISCVSVSRLVLDNWIHFWHIFSITSNPPQSVKVGDEKVEKRVFYTNPVSEKPVKIVVDPLKPTHAVMHPSLFFINYVE